VTEVQWLEANGAVGGIVDAEGVAAALSLGVNRLRSARRIYFVLKKLTPHNNKKRNITAHSVWTTGPQYC